MEFQEDQLKKLSELLHYVNEHSDFYKKRFAENKIDVEHFNILEEFQKIPFTTKEDLQKSNLEFLCVSKTQIRDWVTTSGTSGDPVWFGLTEGDLRRLSYNESLSFKRMGLAPGDQVQLTTTLDRRFLAGLAYYQGAQQMGLGVVRVGSGVPELQWNTILTVKPRALVCVPSFLLKMIEYAETNDIDMNATSVKKVLCIGEPIRNENLEMNTLAARIKAKWNVELFSTYASTEMGTAFTECCEGKGGHLIPELLKIEIIDDEGNVLPNSSVGELVITTLGVEGMPLIRFKTGDVVQGFEGVCACGDSNLRLGPVLGRKNQMIKYKGTSLYPPAFIDILNDLTIVSNYIIEIDSNDLGEDEIIVRISFANSPSLTEEEILLNQIKDKFRAKLRVAPKIQKDEFEWIQKLKFPENSRKSVTFIDKRNKKIPRNI